MPTRIITFDNSGTKATLGQDLDKVAILDRIIFSGINSSTTSSANIAMGVDTTNVSTTIGEDQTRYPQQKLFIVGPKALATYNTIPEFYYDVDLRSLPDSERKSEAFVYFKAAITDNLVAVVFYHHKKEDNLLGMLRTIFSRGRD